MMPKGVLETLYQGRADVFEYRAEKDPQTKITAHQEVQVFSKIPCRVSHKRLSAIEKSNHVPTAQMEIKLFLPNHFIINPGSKIVVIQHGTERVYKSSGIPAVYSSHQEIILEEFRGYGKV